MDDERVKDMLREYAETQIRLETVRKTLKALTERIKDLEPEVFKCLADMGKTELKLGKKGMVKIKESKKNQGLSKKFLEEKLPSIMNVDTEKAKETVTLLLSQRTSEIVPKLHFLSSIEGDNNNE